MDFATLAARIPDAAKDLRLNLSTLERSEHLTPSQAWGAILATALASRQRDVIAAAAAEARKRMEPAHFDAARTAAALMAMNNVYYRFRHLVGDPVYAEIPARLRMQGMNTHGAPHADFELWSIAVSAVNGCGMCMETHEKKLRGQGVSPQAVNDAVRIAAVIHAVAQTLDHEAGLAA
ncbi:MAG: Alkyl hydroperoxide reductase AhpD [Planctomycetes bacterium]|nr:Alkyl hydroperoxide reductase AhpD [Planctomycetota bacterium]